MLALSLSLSLLLLLLPPVVPVVTPLLKLLLKTDDGGAVPQRCFGQEVDDGGELRLNATSSVSLLRGGAGTLTSSSEEARWVSKGKAGGGGSWMAEIMTASGDCFGSGAQGPNTPVATQLWTKLLYVREEGRTFSITGNVSVVGGDWVGAPSRCTSTAGDDRSELPSYFAFVFGDGSKAPPTPGCVGEGGLFPRPVGMTRIGSKSLNTYEMAAAYPLRPLPGRKRPRLVVDETFSCFGSYCLIPVEMGWVAQVVGAHDDSVQNVQVRFSDYGGAWGSGPVDWKGKIPDVCFKGAEDPGSSRQGGWREGDRR